jgi:hypothetical protein
LEFGEWHSGKKRSNGMRNENREIKTITKDFFFEVLEERSEELGKKAEGLIELLNRGLARFP